MVELSRRERVLGLGREVERHREQRKLALHGFDDLGVAVAEGKRARSGEEVDEHVSIEILHVRAQGALDRDRQVARVRPRVRLVRGLAFEQLGRAGAGKLRSHERRVESGGLDAGLGFGRRVGCRGHP